jgi:hypothetical protein
VAHVTATSAVPPALYEATTIFRRLKHSVIRGLKQHYTRTYDILSVACTAFLAIGIACALAAALTGVVYKEDTLVDWQAVQAWRIEWLLAAMAALLAGILLKKKNGSS